MQVVTAKIRNQHESLIGAMFADRKRARVDPPLWDVPALDANSEIDRYDTHDAIYVIDDDERGRHLASVRFLPTTRPHPLSDSFSFLCAGRVPVGPDIWEVGRTCFSPDLAAKDVGIVAARLSGALVECALFHRMATLTTFAPVQALSRALAWGWDFVPLGPPQTCDGVLLGAFSLGVSADSLGRFRDRLGLRSPVIPLPLGYAA